jgi:hypothetical protein
MKFINTFILIFAIIKIIISISRDVKYYKKFDFLPSQIAFWLGIIAFITITHVKKKQIKRFITRISGQLSDHELAAVKSFSVRAVLFFSVQYCLIILCNVPFTPHHLQYRIVHVVRTIFIYSHDEPSPFLILIATLVYLMESLITQCWMGHAVCLYSIVHHLKHRFILRQYNSVIKCGHPTFCITLIEHINAVNREFNRIFSIFPFLMLTVNFFLANGFILSNIKGTAFTEIDLQIQTISKAIIYLIYIVFLVMIVSHRHQEVERKAREIVIAIGKKHHVMIQDVNLIKEIERSVTKEKVWAIDCDIQQSLLISFIGHMVTFSALFYQMIRV